MSTYFGLYCTTCSSASPTVIKYFGKEYLKEAITLLPHYKAIMNSLHFVCTMDATVGGDWDTFFLWLRDHEGHAFLMRHEYGNTEALS